MARPPGTDGAPVGVTLRAHPLRLAVCRLGAGDPVLPGWVTGADWWAAVRSGDERTAVVPVDSLPRGREASGPWAALEVRGPLAHDVVGVLSSLTAPLAGASVPVFVVSTYDTDWLLVPAGRREQAVRALQGAGHRVDGPPGGGDVDPLVVRPGQPGDAPYVEQLLRRRWGATEVVSRGVLHRADRLPALVATTGSGPDRRCGLLTYRIEGGSMEIVTLDADPPGRGTGGVLLEAAVAVAADRGCRRVWLVTTNDNTDALRFYQTRGFRLEALHRGAVDRARDLKPAIPVTGAHGIGLHDELELARTR